MHQIQSLVDMSLKEAIDVLAETAAAARAHPPSYQEKCALEVSDLLGSLGNFYREQPILAQSLLGGVAGAGLGAGGTLLGNLRRNKEDRRSIWGGLLTGGLAGAGIGAGVGLARKHWPFGGSNATPPSGAGPTFTYRGQNYQISREALAQALEQNPNLVSEIGRMTTPGWGESIFNAAPATTIGLGAGASLAGLRSLGQSTGPAHNADALTRALSETASNPSAQDAAVANLMRSGNTQNAERAIQRAMYGNNGVVRFFNRLNPFRERMLSPDALIRGTSVIPPHPLPPGAQGPLPPPTSIPGLTRNDIMSRLRRGQTLQGLDAARMPQPSRWSRLGRNLLIPAGIGAGIDLLRPRVNQLIGGGTATLPQPGSTAVPSSPSNIDELIRRYATPVENP